MKMQVRFLPFLLFFLFQSVCAQVQLETVYVSRKKAPKAIPVVRYYYYPNLEAYYDTCNDNYILKKDGQWTTADHLAPNYRGYCLYNSFYVVLEDFTEDEPYSKISEHKKKYPANFSSQRKKVPDQINKREIVQN